MPLRIGFSYAPDSDPYPNYHNATLAAGARLGLEIETLDLSETRGSLPVIDGIVFTGGEDVNPQRYGKARERALCGVLNDERDEHELKIFEIAQTRQLPALGICRGLQLLNVALGGSLITHLPSAATHTKQQGHDARHAVATVPDSIVASLCGERGDVNSSHHQAVDRVASELVVTARAEDGTIEALERVHSSEKPLLFAVQWHPERMDQRNPLAGPLFERFLLAVDASSRSSV